MDFTQPWKYPPLIFPSSSTAVVYVRVLPGVHSRDRILHISMLANTASLVTLTSETHGSRGGENIKKLTVALLVGVLALVPALAVAQTGGAGGTQPSQPSGGTSPSMDKPGVGQPSGTPRTPSDPAASPPGGDSFSQHKTKAACEKAGGAWSEATQACSKKKM
jgi:hypothetical protein